MIKAILSRTLFLVVFIPLALCRPASAQEAPGLIRDAEIENLIRAYATPLWKAAGLDASFVQIYLVDDPQINAFVAGGQRLFVNTGLLMRADKPNQVIGVIAHETGHIAGGHLGRTQEALENATAQSIIAFLLGAAGAVVTRNGEVAAAGGIIGQSVGLRSLFAYSVGQEARADQAGLKFLDLTHQSARGLLEFFEKLEKEEILLPAQQDPYLRTHPLTQERIDYVREHVNQSPYSDNLDSPELIDRHNRMLAKLRGFLSPPGKVLETYPDSDNSTYAHYARAAAYHRSSMDDRAISEVDILLKGAPDDPYYNELKGQILFEGGQVAKAVPCYRKAAKIMPDSALLQIEYAQVALEADDGEAVAKDVIAPLKAAIKLDSGSPDAWHALGIAQGRIGDMGEAALALAEEAILTGDFRNAVQQATRATQLLPRGSASWLRAEDIRSEVKVERGNRS